MRLGPARIDPLAACQAFNLAVMRVACCLLTQPMWHAGLKIGRFFMSIGTLLIGYCAVSELSSALWSMPWTLHEVTSIGTVASTCHRHSAGWSRLPTATLLTGLWRIPSRCAVPLVALRDLDCLSLPCPAQ